MKPPWVIVGSLLLTGAACRGGGDPILAACTDSHTISLSAVSGFGYSPNEILGTVATNVNFILQWGSSDPGAVSVTPASGSVRTSLVVSAMGADARFYGRDDLTSSCVERLDIPVTLAITAEDSSLSGSWPTLLHSTARNSIDLSQRLDESSGSFRAQQIDLSWTLMEMVLTLRWGFSEGGTITTFLTRSDASSKQRKPVVLGVLSPVP